MRQLVYTMFISSTCESFNLWWREHLAKNQNVFLWYIQFNVKYLTLNKNNLVIQTHHSTFELLFWVYCLYIAFLNFYTCNKYIKFEEQHVYLNLLNLIFMTDWEQISEVHLFCCFPWDWILFPCLYFDTNCST